MLLDKFNNILVAEVNGKVVVFANGHKNRDNSFEYDCEISAIYVLKDFKTVGFVFSSIGNPLE